MIGSICWKQDLQKFAKKFNPVKNPPRWSERLQVNFEKEIIIAFFIIRKLADSHRISSKMLKYRAKLYRSRNVGKISNLNFSSIERLYDLEKRERFYGDIRFLCNQLIHGGVIQAVRGQDRNWEGIYTCSDFERQRYIYFLPIMEIVKILKLVSDDYPSRVKYLYRYRISDYRVTTN